MKEFKDMPPEIIFYVVEDCEECQKLAEEVKEDENE